MNTKILFGAAFGSSLCLLPSAFGQGALTPPGAPAPMMKSLDQIEARTPVDTIHTPGTFSDLFTITNSGSYYLTANVAGVSGKYGIGIQSSDVTLDLNGFSVIGTSSSLEGIYVHSPGYANVTVRNGVISGWTQSGEVGIFLGQYATFEHLRVSGNYIGVLAFDGGIVRDCQVSGNQLRGIEVDGSGCLIVGNNCTGNNTANSTGGAGIDVIGSNNRIERNHVAGTGSAGNGILILNNPAYTNNIVIQNSVEGNGANNYSLNSSQIVGPIISNGISGIITNSNPWANFSF